MVSAANFRDSFRRTTHSTRSTRDNRVRYKPRTWSLVGALHWNLVLEEAREREGERFRASHGDAYKSSRARKFANPIDFGAGVSLTKAATRSAVVFFPSPAILFLFVVHSLYFNRASSTRLSAYCRAPTRVPSYICPVWKIHGKSFDWEGEFRLQHREVCVLAIWGYEIWRETLDRTRAFKDLSKSFNWEIAGSSGFPDIFQTIRTGRYFIVEKFLQYYFTMIHLM